MPSQPWLLVGDRPVTGRNIVTFCLAVAAVVSAVAVTAAVASGAASGSSSSSGRSAADREYLASLDRWDVEHDGWSNGDAITTGHNVCTKLGRGQSYPQVEAWLMSPPGPTFGLGDAAMIVGGAVNAYCPEYSSANR